MTQLPILPLTKLSQQFRQNHSHQLLPSLMLDSSNSQQFYNNSQKIFNSQQNLQQICFYEQIPNQIELSLFGIKNKLKFLNSFRKFIIDKQSELFKEIQLICQPLTYKVSLFERHQNSNINKSHNKLKDSMKKCQNSLNDIKQYLIKIISAFIDVQDPLDLQEEKNQYISYHKKQYNIFDEITSSFNQNIELLKIQVKSKVHILNILRPGEPLDEYLNNNTCETQSSDIQSIHQIQKNNYSKTIMLQNQKNIKQLKRTLIQLTKQFDDLKKQRDDLLETIDTLKNEYASCNQKLNKKQSLNHQFITLSKQVTNIGEQMQKICQDLNSMKDQILQVITTQVDQYLEIQKKFQNKLPCLNQNQIFKNSLIELQSKLNQSQIEKREYIQRLIIKQNQYKEVEEQKQQKINEKNEEIKQKNHQIEYLGKQIRQKQILLQRRQQQINFCREKITESGTINEVLKQENEKIKYQINILQNKVQSMKHYQYKNKINHNHTLTEQLTQKNFTQIQQLKIKKQIQIFYKERQNYIHQIKILCQSNLKLTETLKRKELQIAMYQQQIKNLIKKFKSEISAKIHLKTQNSQILGKTQKIKDNISLQEHIKYQKIQKLNQLNSQKIQEVQLEEKTIKTQEYQDMLKSICLKVNQQVYNIEQKMKKSTQIQKLYVKQLQKKRLENKELKRQLVMYKTFETKIVDQQNQ